MATADWLPELHTCTSLDRVGEDQGTQGVTDADRLYTQLDSVYRDVNSNDLTRYKPEQ